jgi:outer membrane protein OmpA-like peptidoglycan-associated protein
MAAPAAAQGQGVVPTTEEFIKLLTPDDSGGLAKGRGLSVTETVGTSEPGSTVGPQVGGLYFKFASAELDDRAKEVLDWMAEALLSQDLARYRYSITGHADAVGGEDYNLGLSERRAASVKGYLVAQGVGADRLETFGVGESDLADPDNPDSGVNRRVVVNVTP